MFMEKREGPLTFNELKKELKDYSEFNFLKYGNTQSGGALTLKKFREMLVQLRIVKGQNANSIYTEKEFEELMEKCTWEWTTIKDVNGYKVTGTNGNYIFLPAAGFYGNNKKIRHEGEYGYYNTATTGDNAEEFRNIRFWNYEPNIEWGKRNYGRSIRAVAAK